MLRYTFGIHAPPHASAGTVSAKLLTFILIASSEYEVSNIKARLMATECRSPFGSRHFRVAEYDSWSVSRAGVPAWAAASGADPSVAAMLALNPASVLYFPVSVPTPFPFASPKLILAE